MLTILLAIFTFWFLTGLVLFFWLLDRAERAVPEEPTLWLRFVVLYTLPLIAVAAALEDGWVWALRVARELWRYAIYGEQD